MAKFFTIFIFFIQIFFPTFCFAEDNSFVSIVNPIRGDEFWDIKGQEPATVLKGEAEILQQYNIAATWLIRFDALSNQEISNVLRNLTTHEKGLFLEVTPGWSKAASVKYHRSQSWHFAGSAFLTGYERVEREKLIDKAFEKFKNVFGFYPKSVGAWWIDAYSLDYMQKKYGIVAALIVSDQYSTDNYQIWGKYWSTPYYPSKKDALNPAQTLENKLNVVMLQWAARDPINAYGNGVLESTYSVQANDYLDYHGLKTDYFSSLINIYTKQKFNNFSHLVVGLENSYSWDKYSQEYKNQLQALNDKNKVGQFSFSKISEFANWYMNSFPKISPEQIIIADDPLNSEKKVIWFMNPYFRAGLFIGKDGIVFRDIRQYIDGEEEICYNKACSEVNFATFATRVLDDVTYGQKIIVEEGKISDISLSKLDDKFVLSYKNEAGRSRQIEFLQRDIKIDNKVSSIDGLILQAISKSSISEESKVSRYKGVFEGSLLGIFLNSIKFLIFIVFALFIPGYILIKKILKLENNFSLNIFLSISLGFVSLTIVGLIAGLLKIWWLPFLYIIPGICIFIFFKFYKSINFSLPRKDQTFLYLLILAGSIFQFIPVFKSGLIFDFGMGFWGPNAHDGFWHIALINQLIKGLPPQNPILSGTNLQNYHYFYDLLLAITYNITRIPIVDLLFRFYPLLLSIMLGIGSLHLLNNLSKSKVASLMGLFFVYFAGSFGWIVEFLRERHFGGESAFWVNQPISFNLNPPFAISLVLIVAMFNVLIYFLKNRSLGISLILILLVGSLIEFKAYASIIMLGSLFIAGILNVIFKKDLFLIKILIGSLLLSIAMLFSSYSLGQLLSKSSGLFIWAPFWFIHSMVDSPDRVGWVRLSLARVVGLQQGNWFKFISAEVLGLLIFILGNLGMRILGFGVLLKYKAILRKSLSLFILIFSILSISIPLLIIQTGNPWNTIQFFYYGLYTSAIAAGIAFAWIYSKVLNLGKFILLVTIIIIGPINAVVTAGMYSPPLAHAIISKEETKALNFLTGQRDGIVLTYPYDKDLKKKLAEPLPVYAYDTTAYVSAMSNKQIFESDEIQNDILQGNDYLYKKRLAESKQFFNERDFNWSKKFLLKNNIKYIYLPKIYKIDIDRNNLNLERIFENSEIEIYRMVS